MLMVLSIVANYPTITTATDENEQEFFDPVEEILTLS
jgi:hypothetical protein